jgi:hypothetical protein
MKGDKRSPPHHGGVFELGFGWRRCGRGGEGGGVRPPWALPRHAKVAASRHCLESTRDDGGSGHGRRKRRREWVPASAVSMCDISDATTTLATAAVAVDSSTTSGRRLGRRRRGRGGGTTSRARARGGSCGEALEIRWCWAGGKKGLAYRKKGWGGGGGGGDGRSGWQTHGGGGRRTEKVGSSFCLTFILFSSREENM